MIDTPPTSRRAALVAVFVFLATAPSSAEESTPGLNDVLARGWEFRLNESPLLATSVGDHRANDRLPDVSRSAQLRRAEFWRRILAELKGFDYDQLSTAERIDYDVFRRQVEDAIASVDFGAYQMPFNADSGFQTGIAGLPRQVPLATVEDYENYIDRLRAIPAYFDQHIANMRTGLERGFSQPREVLDGIVATAAAHVVDQAAESVFYAPFESFPERIDGGERTRLETDGRQAILEAVGPAYAVLAEFFESEYLPQTRPTGGAGDLPDGRDYYRHQVRYYTTLDLTPEEIHQIGLDEVARIRAEMQAVIEEVGFEGDFAEFLEFLRTDERFYPQSADELMKHAAWLAKRADAQMPSMFGKMPRLPYGVEPVPEHIAPKYTAGRYVSAPAGSTRAGTYWVNTYALDTRPFYNLESLTLHEAVPGHHHQVALAAELENVPPFRRFDYISAFGEGWGLYAERLGLEMGFYTDPYSDFGRLTYEMWRACRLVVDTGVHAMGWGRQQIMDFMADNTALSRHEIETETDRYISWPAQALSYKLGELEIRRLRRQAEEALGDRFDLRRFHDVVLSQGSVPLGTLGGLIEDFIAGELAASEAGD